MSLLNRFSVVKYKDDYYFVYGRTKNNRIKMLDMNGKRYSGTPSEEKVSSRPKKFKEFIYNEVIYTKTLIGYISQNGKLITSPEYELILDKEAKHFR
tara:strand:+ start:188 stop:478 length:291 start_codon:yes stop_codon:yes gene_type:complete